MINRNEFIKKFELAVQQEIKNYNNSLSSIYLSLNELRKDIDVNHSDLLESYALSNSNQKNLEIEIEKIKLTLSELKSSFTSSSNNQKVINEKNAELVEQNKCKFISLMSNISLLRQESNKLLEWIRTKDDESKKEFISIIEDLNHIQSRFSKDLNKTKEDILSKPKDISLYQNLDEKINSHAVDVKGIMKEINIFKHETHILEKKIENLYTLIERINKRLTSEPSINN